MSRAAGHDDEKLLAVNEHLRARFNRGLGITPDGYNEGHACVLPAHLQPTPGDRP